MAVTSCRYFSGYKPCGLNETCTDSCPQKREASPRILIVHLEAMGAVLRATSILPAIKRLHPNSHITWVTKSPSDHLLKPQPLIDRVLTLSSQDQLILRALEFDLALVIDKSLEAAGVLRLTKAQEVRGFIVDPKSAAILPANNEAEELWNLGLSNFNKFYVNQKPETQLMIEALKLGPFQRDEYQIELTPFEKALAQDRRQKWLGTKKWIVGLNTGCSPVIPYKKWTVEFHQRVIESMQTRFPSAVIVLLGGPEDEVRNQRISATQAPLILSPTTKGLRDGLVSVEACDVVVTGDSLGMHMAIALKKWVVAWFGPTCAQEIDLFDRGVKLYSEVSCAPCWKRSCSQNPMCYDQVPLSRVMEAIEQGLVWKTSSSKPPFLETSSLASP